MKIHVHLVRCYRSVCAPRHVYHMIIPSLCVFYFFIFSFFSLYFGKSLATLPCVNPQPSREQETDGWREQERLREVRARTAAKSVCGRNYSVPPHWSTTQSYKAEPKLTLTSKSLCLNTHHSTRRQSLL